MMSQTLGFSWTLRLIVGEGNVTSLSENALYYFGKQELSHKLILIEDLDGAGEVLYPLRELQSKKVITKTVVYKNQAGEAQTVHLRVEGPICVAGCTTKESVYEDNSNRSFLLHLDETKEQDEKIMHYQQLKRNAVILGLIVFQGVHSGELQKIEMKDVSVDAGTVYIPSTGRSASRTLSLQPAQILPIHEYLHETRPKLKPKGDELFPGDLHNIINRLVQELQGINPAVTNALHIRGSVIINWIKQHNKRQVQYMAGHKYISSTEAYQLQIIDSLLDELSKHHPFG